jgi:hypothetical protein
VPASSLISSTGHGADSLAPSADALHRRRALRLRQTLVVALAVVSGATDAIGLLTLGGAGTW